MYVSDKPGYSFIKDAAVQRFTFVLLMDLIMFCREMVLFLLLKDFLLPLLYQGIFFPFCLFANVQKSAKFILTEREERWLVTNQMKGTISLATHKGIVILKEVNCSKILGKDELIIG